MLYNVEKYLVNIKLKCFILIETGKRLFLHYYYYYYYCLKNYQDFWNLIQETVKDCVNSVIKWGYNGAGQYNLNVASSKEKQSGNDHCNWN